jgi:hypothetical protein
MDRSKAPDDQDLDAIQRAEADLDAQIAELTSLPDRLKRQREELASTLPPPDDFEDRERQRIFEERASRGKIRNERKAQRRSLLLLILLIAATASLVAWGLSLMKG